MEPRADIERLFVALLLGEELGARAASLVRVALGLHPRAEVPRHLRLYRGADLHLTLFFLGDVAAERRAALEASLGPALGALPAPDLALCGAGAFPDARRPRVLWLGVHERSDGRLARLAQAVRTACVAHRFQADERPFTAHVTAGRVRAERGRGRRRGPPAPVPEAFFALDPGLEWQPREVALVQSLPGGSEAAYRALRTWPLAVAGA